MFDYSDSDRRKVWEIIEDEESDHKGITLRCGLMIYDVLRIMLEAVGDIEKHLREEK